MAINVTAAIIIVGVITSLYPPELWRYELTLSLSLTFVIATPTSYFMGYQIFKNSQLTDELQRLVNRDRLTDVGTRDFFFARMEEAPDAYGVSLMVDIDHFKGINDKHGHFAGDQVIKCVAQTLKKVARKTDLVARFGGEEFIIFLRDLDPQSGYEVAERMRNQIAEQVFKFTECEVKVTVSIGGSLKDACDNLEAAIEEADAALYQAKGHGRNQTIFATRKKQRDCFIDGIAAGSTRIPNLETA